MNKNNILNDNIQLAQEGEKNWNRFIEQYNMDKYIIMPHIGDEYNYWASLYLTYYLNKEKAKSVALIALSEMDLEKFTDAEGFDVVKKVVDQEWMDSVIKYYAFVMFSSKLTILSLTKPYDTQGENLLGVKGITKRELLCFDIFGFDEIPEM